MDLAKTVIRTQQTADGTLYWIFKFVGKKVGGDLLSGNMNATFEETKEAEREAQSNGMSLTREINKRPDATITVETWM